MFSIRKNCFETNSSSSHTLAITDIGYDNSIFEKNYVIKCIKISNEPTGQYFKTPEEKLTYLYSIWLQARGEESAKYNNFLDILKQIFPKVTFIDTRPVNDKGEKEYIYAFEDGDYLFDAWDDKAEIQPFIDNIELFKEFFKNGVIFFGNRDADCDDLAGDYYKRKHLIEKASFYIDFAG